MPTLCEGFLHHGLSQLSKLQSRILKLPFSTHPFCSITLDPQNLNPKPCAPAQRLQYPLIQEQTLKYSKISSMIEGIFLY